MPAPIFLLQPQPRLKMPNDFANPRLVALFAFGVCIEVRRQSHIENQPDAPYEYYSNQIEELLENLEVRDHFYDDDAYEDFIYQIMGFWSESASGNKFKLQDALEQFQDNPLAYVDERLTTRRLNEAATFCYRLSQAHGGGDAVFYLSCRVLGGILSCDHTTASRILNVLCETFGILELVARHSRRSRRANEYRFKGTMQHITHDSVRKPKKSIRKPQIALHKAEDEPAPFCEGTTRSVPFSDVAADPCDHEYEPVRPEDRKVVWLLRECGIPITEETVINCLTVWNKQGFEVLREGISDRPESDALSWLRYMAN